MISLFKTCDSFVGEEEIRWFALRNQKDQFESKECTTKEEDHQRGQIVIEVES